MTYHLPSFRKPGFSVDGFVFAQSFKKTQVTVNSFHCKWSSNSDFEVNPRKQHAQVS